MNESQHLSSQFDEDLSRLRTHVLQMGGLVETQVSGAIDAYTTGEVASVKSIVETDRKVNELEKAIDDDCAHIIAKRQPAAGDLRLVLSVIKIASDLERIGDEAKKIAKTAKQLHTATSPFMPQIRLSHIADAVVDMLRTALDAYARLDTIAAAQVVRQDKEVDAEFKGIMRQLITYMIEDPRTISQAIELMFVAKSVERIGDHAKNIAEYVVYMVKGRDVRHTSLEEIEREATR